MAVEIRITAEVTGEAPLFEYMDQRGERIMVPTYRCIVKSDTGYRKDFDVTRDTFAGIRGKIISRYAKSDECPPNFDEKPYSGKIIEGGKRGFRIELYEDELCGEYGEAALRGVGEYIRTHIQIHRGPASSEGCFLIAGGDEALQEFETHTRAVLERSHDKNILVHVESRT